MKKTLLLLVPLFFWTLLAEAQMKNVNKVAAYFTSGKIGEKLDDAKFLIDQAIKDEKSASKAKTWFYRAKVYAEILQAKEPAIQQLAPNAAQVVMESMDKVEEIEGKPNGSLGQQRVVIVETLRSALFNRGVSQQETPELAYKSFGQAVELSPSDTLAAKYAGYFASQADKPEEAEKYYQMLIDNPEYKKVDAYHYITQLKTQELQKKQNLVNELKDQDADEAKIKAAEEDLAAHRTETHDFVKKGSEAYPDDIYLLGQNIDFYINQEKYKEAVDMLNKAVKISPENAVLYQNLGLLYYRDLKNEEDAIKNYKKAIEIKPEDFNSQMGIAIIYYNRGAKILSDLKVETYENRESKEIKAVLAHFKDAQPYLEKAHEISAKEMQPLMPLKTVYRELGMREQEKAIDEKLKKLMEEE